MKFGFFDDAQKEYVITNPQTPWPWINYLVTPFIKMQNSVGSPAIGIIMCRWTAVAGISISKTKIQFGRLAGNLAKHRSINMNAGMG